MKFYIFMFILHMSQGLPPITPCFPVNCLVNPCNNYNCSIGSQCVPNYCGGCKAVCKPCVISYCKVNPCLNYRCSVGYQCVPNYCNGCFAECKKCPITICKPCTLFCPKGSKCIVRSDCGKCTYSCSRPVIPIYERKK